MQMKRANSRHYEHASPQTFLSTSLCVALWSSIPHTSPPTQDPSKSPPNLDRHRLFLTLFHDSGESTCHTPHLRGVRLQHSPVFLTVLLILHPRVAFSDRPVHPHLLPHQHHQRAKCIVKVYFLRKRLRPIWTPFATTLIPQTFRLLYSLRQISYFTQRMLVSRSTAAPIEPSSCQFPVQGT